jgi:hypothetical protein
MQKESPANSDDFSALSNLLFCCSRLVDFIQSLHPLYIALPAILLTVMRKGVHITTSRFTEVKTDGSTGPSDAEK